MNDKKLTHFDKSGHAHMVNVGDKAVSRRVAIAEGFIQMKRETLEIIKQGTAKKGDVLGVARVAAIMGAKKTSELIPLCHLVALTRITVEFELDNDLSQVRCEAIVECQGQTGVEIEALLSVHIALLTIYDMCKAIDSSLKMTVIRLVKKLKL